MTCPQYRHILQVADAWYRSFQGGNRIAKNGAPERIRTTNLLIRSQMLYPVELRAPERESVNLRSNDRTVKSC
jgi:hypothetical protein